MNYNFQIKICEISDETNSLIAEPDGSTQLIPSPATRHDPESVPSTSHPHNPFPYALINSLVVEPDGSTPLISQPVYGYDPESVISTSYTHNLFP
jgi:hypothetical protein